MHFVRGGVELLEEKFSVKRKKYSSANLLGKLCKTCIFKTDFGMKTFFEFYLAFFKKNIVRNIVCKTNFVECCKVKQEQQKNPFIEQPLLHFQKTQKSYS